MPTMPTPKQQLIDLQLHTATGQTLAEYVEAHRADGESWRTIARAISNATGTEVTDFSLTRWFGAPEAAAAS